MAIKESLATCLKQAAQMERQVQDLGLSACAQARLAGILRQAKDSLEEAERLLKVELADDSQESTAKLRLWERKLLDLSLRNSLLNMKLGRNAIPFVHDDIATLEDELDMGREFILEQKELKGISRAVRTNMEESGVNTLFLTLGTLVWNEQRGGRLYEAPLLLVPVSIVPMKKGAFAIRKRDEDIILNVTLIVFLKQQLGIEIADVNPLPQDTHGVDVNLVLHRFRGAIKDYPEWTVKESSVLGIFSFSKFVMWNDIHSHSEAVMQSPIIRSLVEGRLVMPEYGEALDARQMDIEVRPDAMAIPVDADSSQLEAVAEAQRGRSFILYGPPGTGKSQTITNLIANSLYHGKRVLFVAEKKAALEVVQSRLAKIGLGPFCLELHSNKMDKQHFLQQMQSAIDAAGSVPPESYRQTADALYAQRLQLIGHVDALYDQTPAGVSLYVCINHYLQLQKEGSKLPLQLPKDFTGELTEKGIGEYCEKITALDSGKSILGTDPKNHKLNGLLPKPKQPQKPAYAMMGGTLDKMLPQLPKIVEGIARQIERGKAMKLLNKTTRQYLEADYQWKKFTALAMVSDDLLDDIDALQAAVSRWNTAIDQLPAWEKYAGIVSSLKDAGLPDVLAFYDSGIPTEEICTSFRAACYRQMALDTIQHNPALSQFSGLQFSQVIDKYNELMREFQSLTRKELVARLSAQVPADTRDPALSAELTLLRKRIASKGRGASIRAIIDQMPQLLPRLCPVMLMSPLSVAQYIDIDAPKFDLVVFDEASQMPTGEAVGSICRGKAAVVVGDPRQMPPTSFFTANATDDDEVDLDDLESILDDCISLSMPSRYLGWHYRSKHESLIAFSNLNYYDGRLVTFPSADNMVPHVTWEHVDGFYDFGNTRTNKAEAEAIVKETISRMQRQPERSIGIVAFSKAQSDLIEDLFEQHISDYPELEVRNRESAEPLFIKNLENVQGDERDIILFSVGYGPDQNGRVSMNFGPLNKAGGERRLNVAISRARYEMKVFSTLLPEQIDERRTQAEGVLGLKRFIRFAQNNARLGSNGGEKENDHQIVIDQLAEALRAKGLEVHTNVGASAIRVDAAIVDPNEKGKYMLGILCDGPGYSRLKTARDREVVRPSVLRMLGWRLARIWTIDWLLRPAQVVEEIMQSVGYN